MLHIFNQTNRHANQMKNIFPQENGQPDGGSVVLGGSGNAVGGLVVGNGLTTGVNCGTIQRQTGVVSGGDKDRKTVTTVEVHQPSPPAPPSMPPPLPYKWPAGTSLIYSLVTLYNFI